MGHNRWHPDIPAVVSVNPGDVFRIECKNWTDGQIKDNDDPNDVRDVDLTVVHVLSGPIYVNGVEPGDIPVVDLLDIGALQGDEWGFTGIFARENDVTYRRACLNAIEYLKKFGFTGEQAYLLLSCAPMEDTNCWKGPLLVYPSMMPRSPASPRSRGSDVSTPIRVVPIKR